MSNRDFPPIHPGEILSEDFLTPMNLSKHDLADYIHVHLDHITEIIQGTCGITADIAIRLGKFFEMEEQFWMNLQSRYDLEMAREQLSEQLNVEIKSYYSLNRSS